MKRLLIMLTMMISLWACSGGSDDLAPEPKDPPKPVAVDSDGDGFNDTTDKCPNVSGTVQGCPSMTAATFSGIPENNCVDASSTFSWTHATQGSGSFEYQFVYTNKVNNEMVSGTKSSSTNITVNLKTATPYEIIVTSYDTKTGESKEVKRDIYTKNLVVTTIIPSPVVLNVQQGGVLKPTLNIAHQWDAGTAVFDVIIDGTAIISDSKNFTFDLSGVAVGSHKLMVVAKKASNTAESASTQIYHVTQQ